VLSGVLLLLLVHPDSRALSSTSGRAPLTRAGEQHRVALVPGPRCPA
jgi:hypothetical protein